MKSRSNLMFAVCIIVNLLVGNLALLMFPDLDWMYRMIISLPIIIIYGTTFYKLDKTQQVYSKWKLAGVSIVLSLFGMLIACIFISIGTRLPMDDIVTAGLKGIIPLFIFSVLLASPFWVSLALVNFICLIYMNRKTN